MKPTDEFRLTGNPPLQRLIEPDRERGELVVGVSRPNERRAPRASVSPQSVVASFNTWAFKREQPDTAAGLLAQVAKSLVLSQPVSFVLYWGKGPRNEAGDKEVACLDFLGQMQARIRQVYAPGAQITIVFTDTHAALNGHKALDAATYFRSVAAILPQSGYDFCHLGSIVRAARPLLMDFDSEAEPLDPLLQADLVTSAQKWYRGPGSAEDGATAYYRANLTERKAMELSFPDSIFVTFNGSALRGIFPDKLPIFYMYSLRKGFAVKPWFLA
jgi:hypothetical protein